MKRKVKQQKRNLTVLKSAKLLKNKYIALGIIFLGLILLLGLHYKFDNRQGVNKMEIKLVPYTPVSPSPIPTVIPTIKPSPPGVVEFDTNRGWKIFTSTKYGFQIRFPARGLKLNYLYRYGCNDPEGCSSEIDCGNNIADGSYQYDDKHGDVSIDNFFRIIIWKIDKNSSIKDYIDNAINNAGLEDIKSFNDLFTLDPIYNSNAEEAYVINHKPGQSNLGGVPFSYSIALYKKGDKLYELIATPPQQPTSSCYAPIKGVEWNRGNSLKLL